MKKQGCELISSALFFVLTFSSNFVVAQSTSQTKPAPKTTAKKPKLTEAEIAEARETLGQLGYWIELEATGLDTSLHHALIAFQKIEGRKRTGILTTQELEALRTAKRPQPREWGFARIEVDLPRQVLFVVDCCGAILRILPISSGSGEWFTEGGRTRQASTPVGRFKVTHQIKERLAQKPVGTALLSELHP